MSRITFENYGRRADSDLSGTEISGRYIIQSDAEDQMVQDVWAKLELTPKDDLLEIGCGVGTILIPLHRSSRGACGIDHPRLTAKLRSNDESGNIETIDGNFLDIKIKRKFSKILVYSVLHCLTDMAEVNDFVRKAIVLLAPGGRLLLGDIPNQDKKNRFLSSAAGAEFEREWNDRMAANPSKGSELTGLDDDPDLVTFDDDRVFSLMAMARGEGLESYLLAQPVDLPFGQTREDIVIIRPEN